MMTYRIIGGPLDGGTCRVPDGRLWMVHQTLMATHPAMLHIYVLEGDTAVYLGVGRLDGGDTDWTAVGWVSYEDVSA